MLELVKTEESLDGTTERPFTTNHPKAHLFTLSIKWHAFGLDVHVQHKDVSLCFIAACDMIWPETVIKYGGHLAYLESEAFVAVQDALLAEAIGKAKRIHQALAEQFPITGESNV